MPGDVTFGVGTAYFTTAFFGASYFGANLTAFVNNGTVPESRIDDMATRILTAWYFLRQDQDYPAVSFNILSPTDQATNKHVDVQEDHFKIVREIGASSAVLLKNNGALPLIKPRSIVIVGTYYF